MCRLSRLGRSNSLPHTSHGNIARSPRVGRAFGDDFGILMDESWRSPVLLAPDEIDVSESPDMLLCSSSPLEGGEIGNKTRDKRFIDKSRGESVSGEL